MADLQREIGGLTVDGMGYEEYRAIHGAAADAEAARLIGEARAACGAPPPVDAPIARRHWGDADPGDEDATSRLPIAAESVARTTKGSP